MRLLICILLLTWCTRLNANTYYFSSISGNDSRSFTEAQNPSTPWKTIEKLNAVFNALKPGDFVLFKSDDIFYGSLFITQSGTSGSPITVGSYGSGAKPIISGFISLANWASAGGNIYQSTSSSFNTTINTVLVNGIPQQMGRYPNSDAANKGYLTIQTTNGSNQLSGDQLSSSNWTGGEVVIRKAHWVIDRNRITSQSGNTITYNSESPNATAARFGYFIQNHLKTLDQQGEWFFNPGEKKLSIFLSNKPAAYNIKASTVNTLVSINNQSNIAFNNISFQGANDNTFQINDGRQISISNCEILYTGNTAVNALGSANLTVQNSTIYYTNNNAFNLPGCSNVTINNNKIKCSGIFAGMGKGDSGSYDAVLMDGDNHTVEFNEIDSTGYNPITFRGSKNTIRNNFVTNFNFTKDDGGGIYSWNNIPNAPANYGTKISGNIVLNGVGADAGTPDAGYKAANGIYMDDNTSNVEITDNTVANCGLYGVYLHNAHEITLSRNTVYNNRSQMVMSEDGYAANSSIRNISMNNNIFFSKENSQLVGEFATINNDIKDFGSFDNNHYCRPVYDNFVINTSYKVDGTSHSKALDVEEWKALYGKDKSSAKSPVSVASGNSIRFEYNATGSSKTFSLDATYIDVNNITYTGSFTLKPYTSIVLIKKDSNDNYSSSCPGTGSILFERWENAGGNNISDIPLQKTPDVTTKLPFVEFNNIGDNYGSRMRGLICPPESGNYTFYLAGDDAAELWISPDDNPANKKKIASLLSWTGFREWDKYASQKSGQIYLQSGHQYYIEVLQKEGAGGDHASVAWRLPGGVLEAPIPGKRVSPYSPEKTGQSLSSNSTSACSATGSILREQWNDVGGNDVSNIPLAKKPDQTSQLTVLEIGPNVDDRYATRIRGYLCPPQSGNYTFLIAGDDAVELWLSTDDNPANKLKIASLLSWTGFREWDKFASQKSAQIYLTTGNRYYIEVLHKEGAGGDHVSVGWQLPNGVKEAPITGTRLSPYVTGNNKSDQTLSFAAISSKTYGDAPFTLSAAASSGLAVSFRIASGPATLSGNTVTITGAGTVAAEALQPGNDNYNAAAIVTQSFTVSASSSECSATGTISREQWNNVDGNDISNIPLQKEASSISEITMLETTNKGEKYGARIRGYLCPPQSGNYTFYISGDDAAELWLSTNDDAANKVKIANLLSWTGFRDWNKYPSQKSEQVYLQKGHRYYIEVLHKQGGGGDHVSVGWQLPDGTMEAPIAGRRLSPYTVAASSAYFVTNNSNTAVTIASSDSNVLNLKAYPNPFKRVTTIKFNPDESGHVKLEVLDLQGRLVKAIFNGTVEVGMPRSFQFDANGWANGVYVIRLSTTLKVLTQKIILGN